MKKYISVLKQTKLFSGVSEKETEAMLGCLDAKLKRYKKGEYIFRQGQFLENISILVKGSILIQSEDYWGNRSIVNHIGVGDMVGEAYAGADNVPILNDVVAMEDCDVVFFNINKLLTTCSATCCFHSKVVQNMFYTVSEKNRKLVQKLGHISKRSTREKLISYLSEEAKKQNSSHITIPFNRQQLADFLSVDRSAMSNELCKMQNEGLLNFKKNQFQLIQTEK
ncbi:MAG: Crp/Fnr family transcriptional regulator [Clostridia bacterium]|nr:Crp/Fnr family transcriptional regulator [Clostridia bacterium]